MRERLTHRRVRLTQRVAKVEPNPMNGLSKRKVVSAINKLLYPFTRGIYRDQDWRNVRRLWKAMNDAGLDWEMTDSKYIKNREVIPSSKVWSFEVHFINERGREMTLFGTVTAAGAGSVEDPLEAYDIVAYVS